jgi:hypothetical protein
MNSTERGLLMPRHGPAGLSTLTPGAHGASKQCAFSLASNVRAVAPDRLQKQTHPPAMANRAADV